MWTNCATSVPQLEEVWEEDGSPLDTLPDPDPLPEEVVEQREIRQCIWQAIGTLPLKQRRIVWMRYADQLTFAEIGRLLHIPESSAKTSFWRARLVLRQELRASAHL